MRSICASNFFVEVGIFLGFLLKADLALLIGSYLNLDVMLKLSWSIYSLLTLTFWLFVKLGSWGLVVLFYYFTSSNFFSNFLCNKSKLGIFLDFFGLNVKFGFLAILSDYSASNSKLYLLCFTIVVLILGGKLELLINQYCLIFFLYSLLASCSCFFLSNSFNEQNQGIGLALNLIWFYSSSFCFLSWSSRINSSLWPLSLSSNEKGLTIYSSIFYPLSLASLLFISSFSSR